MCVYVAGGCGLGLGGGLVSGSVVLGTVYSPLLYSLNNGSVDSVTSSVV